MVRLRGGRRLAEAPGTGSIVRMARRLLLLSNSSTAGMSYLEHAQEPMLDFLGRTSKTVLFVPYAAVRFGYDEYAAKVRAVLEGIGHRLVSVHDAADAVEAVLEAEAIAVGGGNTFHLLRELQERNLLGPIRERTLEGMPFIGWSAGSNIACPTLRTTNDMPIVEPRSFRCLDLIPFQINPPLSGRASRWAQGRDAGRADSGVPRRRTEALRRWSAGREHATRGRGRHAADWREADADLQAR